MGDRVGVPGGGAITEGRTRIITDMARMVVSSTGFRYKFDFS